MAFSKKFNIGCDVICKTVETVTRWSCICLVLIMTAEVIMGVFFRYFLDSPLRWGEELARLLLVWCGLLGITIALRDGEHLGLEFFTSRLKGGIQLCCEMACHLLIGLFLVILLYWGVYISQAAWNTYLPALQIRWTWSYLAVPVTAAIQLIFLFRRIMDTIIRIRNSAPEKCERRTT